MEAPQQVKVANAVEVQLVDQDLLAGPIDL
jgi:hypothetical protein